MKELKCRDLMIGDYIQDKYGMQWQVYSIGNDFAYASNEIRARGFDDKDEKPFAIELTGEMLKRNGWGESSWGYSIRYCRTSDTINNAEAPYLIEYTDSNNLKIFPNYIEDSDVYADIVIPVIYVHELQQALRLAGLSYLADNFKIK